MSRDAAPSKLELEIPQIISKNTIFKPQFSANNTNVVSDYSESWLTMEWNGNGKTAIITINVNQIYSKELHTLLRGVFNMFVFVICLWNEHKRMFINL